VLAIKTPIAFLVLLGAGFLRRHKQAWIPLAFAGGILLVGTFSRINIGIRHILPVYMAFALIAAVGAVHLLEKAGGRRWIAGVVVALALWFSASSVLAHPDYLPYFNELAAGEPERIVVDSDLDWGQDVKRLAARLKELGVQEVTYAHQAIGHFDTRHGLPRLVPRMDVTQPNPGWNAISLTYLKTRRLGLFETHPGVVLWPNRISPLERVGKGILLWYFPPAANAR
jgi:hypothetical protein